MIPSFFEMQQQIDFGKMMEAMGVPAEDVPMIVGLFWTDPKRYYQEVKKYHLHDAIDLSEISKPIWEGG